MTEYRKELIKAWLREKAAAYKYYSEVMKTPLVMDSTMDILWDTIGLPDKVHITAYSDSMFDELVKALGIKVASEIPTGPYKHNTFEYDEVTFLYLSEIKREDEEHG